MARASKWTKMDDLPPDHVLREIAEETMHWQDEFEKVLRAGISGYVACRNCAADAKWSRKCDLWSLECPSCEWNACGSIGDLRTKN